MKERYENQIMVKIVVLLFKVPSVIAILLILFIANSKAADNSYLSGEDIKAMLNQFLFHDDDLVKKRTSPIRAILIGSDPYANIVIPILKESAEAANLEIELTNNNIHYAIYFVPDIAQFFETGAEQLKLRYKGQITKKL